jgi:hypothetical protein
MKSFQRLSWISLPKCHGEIGMKAKSRRIEERKLFFYHRGDRSTWEWRTGVPIDKNARGQQYSLGFLESYERFKVYFMELSALQKRVDIEVERQNWLYNNCIMHWLSSQSISHSSRSKGHNGYIYDVPIDSKSRRTKVRKHVVGWKFLARESSNWFRPTISKSASMIRAAQRVWAILLRLILRCWWGPFLNVPTLRHCNAQHQDNCLRVLGIALVGKGI